MVAAAAALVALAPVMPSSAGAAAAPTSCRSIAHIGDSISVGMESENFLPRKADRLEAQYERIGARDVHLEISGARSAVERHDGRPNAVEAAEELRDEGFHGCWVIAIGTNDAANVAAGSSYGASERIDRVMEIVGDDPVLWVDAKTTTDKGFYADENMRLFNQALAKAHARHPTLEVFHWSDVVRSSWFDSDGIHYTSTGYAQRAALIAAAVAKTFPVRSADD
jgi:lysophospholipase L1-like esterase